MTGKKLADDCFVHAGRLLRHDEAISLLKGRIHPIAGTETVPLTAATGRIVAETIRARHPVPAHTNAAVDGYAFEHAAYAKGTTSFPVVGRAAAGHPLEKASQPGSAVRIFTGAVMPDGLDTVVMQEDTLEAVFSGKKTAASEFIGIPAGLKAGANVRLAGEDVEAGKQLFDVGDVLRPQDLAALASIGESQVPCFKRIRVAIVATGDEIIEAGARPLEAGEVYDANSPMLAALANLAGTECTDLGIWLDKPQLVRERLKKAAESFDVILTTGGASRGEEDHMGAALAELGTRHFWQIAVKPGRPMMFGQIGDSIVVGLPGNPVAVFVCFLMYVAPLLRRLGGTPWHEPRRYRLPATFAVPKRKPGRREFWRGKIVETPKGLAIDKFARDGSGLISGLRAADGLIDMPEHVGAVTPGDFVSFIPFLEFGIQGR